MRKAIPFFFLIFLFSSGSDTFGNPILDVLDVELKVFNGETQKINNEQKKLDKEKEELEKVLKAWDEAASKYNREFDDYQSRVGEYNKEFYQRDREAKAHNNNPDRRSSDPGVSAAYTANAARLRDWETRLKGMLPELDKKKNDLIRTKEQLEKVKLKNDELVGIWTGKQKALDAKREEHAARFEEMKRRVIRNCTLLLNDDSTKEEALKQGCGEIVSGATRNPPTR